MSTDGNLPPDHPAAPVFGDVHRAILEFEQGWWKYQAAKNAEVYTRFAMSSTRYHAVLNWIIEQPEAREYDPATVDRLVRLRDLRRLVRSVGTTAAGVATAPDPRGVRPAIPFERIR